MRLLAVTLVFGTVTLAHADVVDTNQIIAGGTMTVSGNAFSVGGSTLAASGGKVGILTASPATVLDVAGDAQIGSAALKSTFTATPGAGTYALNLASGTKLFNGGPLELTSGGYVKWPDGTTSTTAATAGGGGASGVQLSTASVSISASPSPPNNYNVCIATASLTGHNRPLRITATGSLQNNCNTTAIMGWGFLVNGSFISGFGSSSTGWTMNTYGATYPHLFNTSVIIPPQGTGTINVCIAFYSSLSGSCTYTIPATTGGTSVAYLQVDEIGN